MRQFIFLYLLCLVANNNINAQQPTLEKTILHHDSLFWAAYNACDVDKMLTFVSDDLEFYHDKGGITLGKENFRMSLSQNLCGNKNFRLRREAVAGSVQVFPMEKNNSIYGALISGSHVFYITETGKAEYKDGLARFTQLWLLDNGQWKMTRILSYDHGPAGR